MSISVGDIQRWIVQSSMTVYGRVSAVPSWGPGEAHSSYPMKIAHKPALYRLQHIVTRLVRGDRVTAGRMAAQLEVSVRTVMRDIDYLINVLHVPLRYDHGMKSYVLRGSLPLLFSLTSNVEQEASNDEVEEVVLVYDSDMKEHLDRSVVHPSQRLVQLADGTTQMVLNVVITDALVNWIMGQAGRIHVKQPTHLRERVIDAARRILARQSGPS
jgi:predicted DNA-binding transcriptional regulator YafY